MEWGPTLAPVATIAIAFFAGWRYLDSRFATFDNRLTKLETQMDLLLRGLQITVAPKEDT